MATFTDILAKISVAASGAITAAPDIAQWGTDHVTATQSILQTVGATVAAESNDSGVQQEAQMSA